MTAPERPSAPAAAELLVTTPREGLWRLEGAQAREAARVLLGRRREGLSLLRQVIGGSGAAVVLVGWLLYLLPGGKEALPLWTLLGAAMWLGKVAVDGVRYAALCRELRLSPVELKLLDDALDRQLPDYVPSGTHFIDGKLTRVPDRLDEERVMAAVDEARRAVDAL